MSEERYEIRGKIGQGGVGAVYRAYDTQLRREVAIKRVLASEEGEGIEDPEVATKNLLKEATALSSVQHPHICTVYDAGIDKEGPFVVMELINGKTLDEMVERGTLTFDDFREVAIQSQEAMIAAQDLDLVHRDLKPSNVMVCWLPSGRFQVKLVDFGLAKFSAKPSLQTIDHGDAVFGSIFFMAPEQFERTPLDRRTDMYALGCMYYYSLAGTYPFNGDSAPQVMASHLQNSVQPLQELRPDLPQWVCEWVMWHLARNMDDRPESARVALEKFLTDETTAAQNGGAMPLRTGPQLIIPATSPQANQPAQPSTTVGTHTAPQTIAPPNGQAVVTAAQAIQPASAITGGTAIQPARPAVTPGGVIHSATDSQGVVPATGPQAVTSPQNISASNQSDTPEVAPDVANQLGGMDQKKKFMVIGGLGAAILLVVILIFNAIGDNEDNKSYTELINQMQDLTARDLPTTKEDTEILLNALNDPEITNKTNIFQRLNIAKAEGDDFSIDSMLVSSATSENTRPEHSKKLAEVIAARNDAKSTKALLEWATKNPSSPVTAAAIKGASKTISEDNFKSFITILRETTDASVKSLAENHTRDIIDKARNKTRFSTQLVGAYQATTSKDFKLRCLRLLGSTGTANAKGIILEALKSDNTTEIIAAAKAFSYWPNDDPLNDLLDAYDNADAAVTKNSIFNSAVDLLSADRPHNSSQITENWLTLAGSAVNDEQKKKVIGKARQANAKWSKPVINLFLDDSSGSIREAAKRALNKLDN